ncbi:hypothetical protein Ltuc_0456 [Legionella tucsonensis]|uniref:Uncharacterized protein n=1 Tax=Legionella tucsonensis TaxID=40335 RepID=A0A0W0ZTY6_9GAMM|nr:hypothetical protein Ltuc_0456 [Legionella tucsonensis]
MKASWQCNSSEVVISAEKSFQLILKHILRYNTEWINLAESSLFLGDATHTTYFHF